MEEMKVQSEEQEIDLLEVFCVLWHRAWILLLSLVAGVVLAGAVTYLAGVVTSSAEETPEDPVYQAYSTIYTFSANTDVETFLMELELTGSLAADFRILGTTHEVVESALDACGAELSYEDVIKSIAVSSPTAHMLRVTVNNEDPQLAAQLSDAMADQLKLKVAEVMGIDTPAAVERATVPTEPINAPPEPTDSTNPISADLKRNCMLGGLVCLMLAAGAVLLVHFVGDSFKEKMAVIRRNENVKKKSKKIQMRGLRFNGGAGEKTA